MTLITGVERRRRWSDEDRVWRRLQNPALWSLRLRVVRMFARASSINVAEQRIGIEAQTLVDFLR
jgi:hypothetical protein